nr:unnamed protein product [Digitaria exilis]
MTRLVAPAVDRLEKGASRRPVVLAHGDAMVVRGKLGRERTDHHDGAPAVQLRRAAASRGTSHSQARCGGDKSNVSRRPARLRLGRVLVVVLE